jgi:hypothetical protein
MPEAAVDIDTPLDLELLVVKPGQHFVPGHVC